MKGNLITWFFLSVFAAHLHLESVYRDAWCKGETEVRLLNGNRADCITEEYAVEVEFAKKFHEGIGQALDYADQTGKKPGILLILETEKDMIYYKRLMPVASKYGITVWPIKPEQLIRKGL